MEAPAKKTRYPLLYQVNTRLFLAALSSSIGRAATLDDIPDEELDRWAEDGFEWAWLLSVWQTGPAGQAVSRSNPAWRREFEKALPDLREEDIAGSGFAITTYQVNRNLGGKAALARLRERLTLRGLRLMLDFVPNHTALDHPWIQDHPDYYVHGTERDMAISPESYVRVARGNGDLVLAHGKDPYFPAWPDTLQLNYGNRGMQSAMLGELEAVADQCDGVRCDMAMLLLPDVFQRTWGVPAEPFWPEAIRRVRARAPHFCFMAEVYWDLEWSLIQQGFDYAYDKRLYDRLRAGQAQPVQQHLQASLSYQDRLARFLENHDEARAATTFPPGMHEAAAIVTYLSPGLRFFHQGQLEGRTKHVPPHLIREPTEHVDKVLQRYYQALVTVLRRPSLQGAWRLLDCTPAWTGNWTFACCIAWCWDAENSRTLVAVNYSDHQSQCYVRWPWASLVDKTIVLDDLISRVSYDRDGSDLIARGLYLDLSPWAHHVFDISGDRQSCQV